MSDERGEVRGMLGRLRHPWLFGIAAVMLVADLAIPDIVPFVDEVLLAAATTGFALLRKRRTEKTAVATDAPVGTGEEKTDE